jgi:allantoate deiminase
MIMEWMGGLGLRTVHTVDGTVCGVWPGSEPGAAPLLVGSHYDSVIDAGRFDGPLGIVCALEAVEALKRQGVELPFPLHLLAFSDEEGVRFQTTYLGSRSVIGALDAETLGARDGSGRTLAEVLEEEGWHEDACALRYPAGSTRGYVEVHIEQGRVLEERGLPAAVVTAIAGQTRLAVRLTGQGDHAGTTPMALRRDALTGAAECCLSAEGLARERVPGVITVGKLAVHPGASNSIPQRVDFTVDLRHPEDEVRHGMQVELQERFLSIAEERGLQMEWRVVQENAATRCDSSLTHQMLDALEAVAGYREGMISGAGHDGVALAAAMPIAMLFLRCRGGISHHPDEFASEQDIETGIAILTRFLIQLSA